MPPRRSSPRPKDRGHPTHSSNNAILQPASTLRSPPDPISTSAASLGLYHSGSPRVLSTLPYPPQSSSQLVQTAGSLSTNLNQVHDRRPTNYEVQDNPPVQGFFSHASGIQFQGPVTMIDSSVQNIRPTEGLSNQHRSKDGGGPYTSPAQDFSQDDDIIEARVERACELTIVPDWSALEQVFMQVGFHEKRGYPQPGALNNSILPGDVGMFDQHGEFIVFFSIEYSLRGLIPNTIRGGSQEFTVMAEGPPNPLIWTHNIDFIVPPDPQGDEFKMILEGGESRFTVVIPQGSQLKYTSRQELASYIQDQSPHWHKIIADYLQKSPLELDQLIFVDAITRASSFTSFVSCPKITGTSSRQDLPVKFNLRLVGAGGGERRSQGNLSDGGWYQVAEYSAQEAALYPNPAKLVAYIRGIALSKPPNDLNFAFFKLEISSRSDPASISQLPSSSHGNYHPGPSSWASRLTGPGPSYSDSAPVKPSLGNLAPKFSSIGESHSTPSTLGENNYRARPHKQNASRVATGKESRGPLPNLSIPTSHSSSDVYQESTPNRRPDMSTSSQFDASGMQSVSLWDNRPVGPSRRLGTKLKAPSTTVNDDSEFPAPSTNYHPLRVSHNRQPREASSQVNEYPEAGPSDKRQKQSLSTDKYYEGLPSAFQDPSLSAAGVFMSQGFQQAGFERPQAFHQTTNDFLSAPTPGLAENHSLRRPMNAQTQQYSTLPMINDPSAMSRYRSAVQDPLATSYNYYGQTQSGRAAPRNRVHNDEPRVPHPMVVNNYQGPGTSADVQPQHTSSRRRERSGQKHGRVGPFQDPASDGKY